LANAVRPHILSGLAIVALMTVLAKGAFVARELVIAHAFGTQSEVDAFLIAFAVPSFFVTVLAGSLNAALIPTFIDVRTREGRERAQRLVSNALALNVALLVAATLVSVLVLPRTLHLMGSNFSPATVRLATQLAYLLLPIIVFSGLSTTWGAVLNAERRFVLVAAAPVATALVPMLAVVLYARRFGIGALTVGTIAGYVVEACVVAVGLRRHGFSPTPRWSGLDAATKSVLRQYIPMVAGSLVLSSTALINQALAGMLPHGTVASLSYGGKIASLVGGIGALSLSTVILPHFSEMVARRDFKGLRAVARTQSLLVLVGTIPVTLFLILLSRPLTKLLFFRGAFTLADVDNVSHVQVVYLLQIPSYLLGMIMVRLISAMRANHVLLIGALISLAVNAGVGYALAKYLGAVGIALTVAIVYSVSYGFLYVMARSVASKLERAS
jgi:putative peptidoglycan lipid II flippase